MMNSVNWSLFPGGELLTFANRAIPVVEPLRASVPALAPFIDRATVGKASFQAALERESKNPMTPVVAQKDQECDAAFLAFRTYAEACSFRAATGWKEAAEKITGLIRNYGWTAYGLGYKSQVAAETSIISELKNRYAAEMETIGAATPWFSEFETAKTALDAALQQSIAEAPTGGPTIVETRPVLIKELKALFAMVSLLNANDDAPAGLKAAEVSLNELITTSLATVKAAGTRAANVKKVVPATPEENK